MMSGSTPQTPPETIRASGLRPACCAASADATTTAAAPSLIPDAFPGVTVPFFSKRACSFARASSVVSARMCSSLSTTASPFFVFTVTGTISSLNRQSSRAFAASV